MHFKMQAFVAFIVCCVGVVIATPSKTERIVGGLTVEVSQYSDIVALLYAATGTNYRQSCGGSILTTKVILTAAQCPYGEPVYKWRVRVGSSYANSGGTVYGLTSISVHPDYNYMNYDSDIALMRTSTPIVYGNIVKAARIAGLNYNLADNEVVWAVGWGRTSTNGPPSEQLRHTQIWTINQATCQSRYATVGSVVTDNMLCAGWLNVGGRDQCQGDSGGPLYHNGVVVGVSSWGRGCADPNYPGVNTRVSRFTTWIQTNALS